MSSSSSSSSATAPATASPTASPTSSELQMQVLCHGARAAATTTTTFAGPRCSREEGDDAVRATDDDAVKSRMSAVMLGYLADPWVSVFVRGPKIRRPPIINRGTYARVSAIDRIVDAFLHAHENTSSSSSSAAAAAGCQILSLGAGTDSRFFRYLPRLRGKHCYFEVDFIETTLKKISCIRRCEQRRQASDNNIYPEWNDFFNGSVKIDAASGSLVTEEYKLVSGDLRDWNLIAQRLIEEYGFDTSKPTLVLSECVFVYLEPEKSLEIMNWISRCVPRVVLVDYTAIEPDDVFGQTMLKNLRARNIAIPGIFAARSVNTNIDRLEQAVSNSRAVAFTVCDFWNRHVSDAEKQRIANIEIFDEIEEWNLIGEHYCFVICTRNIELNDEILEPRK